VIFQQPATEASARIFATTAGLPPPETAPAVRESQAQQLAVALDWLDREL
jgi:hypothetical protein